MFGELSLKKGSPSPSQTFRVGAPRAPRKDPEMEVRQVRGPVSPSGESHKPDRRL